MATQRQIEANRRNAERSTGPKSAEGRARSSLNATKHGLCARSTQVEAALSPEFQDRRDKWAAEHNPVGQAGNWAMDRAVAATFRIERCEREVETLCAVDREHAELAWDQDRALEAASVASRLPKDPVVASRKLQTTLAGVSFLIEAWLGLAQILEDGDWSESEASMALDLLGVSPAFRAGKTRIDAPEGSDPVAFRLDLALDEVERLEALHDGAMVRLDEVDRTHAMAGDATLHSKRAALVLRYERDAWRRFNQAMKELKEPAEAAAPAPLPAAILPPPRPVAPPKSRPEPSFEDERRAVLAQAAPYVAAVNAELRAMGIEDEDAMIEELERRIEALADATERTRFGAPEVGPMPPSLAMR